MKKGWLVKTLALGFVIFFICMNFKPSFAFDNVKKSLMSTSNGNILYVGGNGTGNYSNIQDAINHAAFGDTIFVYHGVYNEYVNIKTHNISLIGENNTNTILWGHFQGNYLTYVTIYNFTIRDDINKAILLNYGGFNKIINCIIDNTGWGIVFQNFCSNNLIINCTCRNSGLGVYLLISSNNDIINCNFYNNNKGIIVSSNSNYNTIINCSSYNNEIGIELYDDSVGNMVLSNNLLENNDGIYISLSSTNNYLYHNNLVDNQQNAISSCINIWDDGYPSGGNYWSDYNGSDNDGDGIGDTPYQIPGDNNVDNYPLMNIWVNNNAPIIHLTWEPNIPNKNESVIFDASRSFDCDGNIVLYEWDWDNDGVYDESHNVPTASHSWPMTGYYEINLKVSDNEGLEENVTKTIFVNQSPGKPSIDGPSKGITGIEYIFIFNANDPDGDNIYYEYSIYESYYHSVEGKIGPFPSGTNGKISYSFTVWGTQYVEARTVDINGKVSDWSSFPIQIPRTRVFNDFNWLNFLKQFSNTFQNIRHLVGMR